MGNLRKIEENFPYFLEHVREVLDGLPFLPVRYDGVLHCRGYPGVPQEPRGRELGENKAFPCEKKYYYTLYKYTFFLKGVSK